MFESWFSPSVMWTPGTEFRLLGSDNLYVCVFKPTEPFHKSPFSHLQTISHFLVTELC